jgi:hypothetical protein
LNLKNAKKTTKIFRARGLIIKAEISLWDRYLESPAFTMFTGLVNRETCDAQNLSRQEEPETGIFKMLAIEDRFFVRL